MEWRHTRWDEPQLVYTAIAKVANTSLKSALLASFQPDVSRHNPHAADVPYRTIRPNRIGAEAPGFCHFAVVRNPYDRFVSFWADKIDGDGMTGGLEALGFRRGMSFEAAARRASEIPDEATDPHIRSQAFLLADDHGRLRPDLLLRFERLHEDWRLLQHVTRRRTGAELNSLPRRRVSEHDTYLEYYDDETKAVIRQRYAQDFELLGYEGSPVRRRIDAVDDALDAILGDRPDCAVLDLTPPTHDRLAKIADGCGHYLGLARHNRLGQLARLTALEQDRVPPPAFDVLVTSHKADREPHRSLRAWFEAEGRPVVLA